MNTMKRKGFTLVELLVVIAILAILATVSVVGYTAMIERANVSADQFEVEQLNHFLDVLKSDNTSNYFNKDINEWNVRQATKEVLELSGLNGKLKPRSGENGYNVYFDLTEQEYVLAKDEDIIKGEGKYSPLLSILGFAAGNERIKQLGSSMSPSGRFFIVSTEGNPLAEYIDRFYNLGTNEEDGSKKDYNITDVEAWRDDATNVLDVVDHNIVIEFVKNSAVANGQDAYQPSEGNNTNLIYPDNSQNQVPSNAVVKNDKGQWVIDEDEPVVTGDVLPVPDDAETMSKEDLKKYEDLGVKIGVDSAERLAEMLEKAENPVEVGTEIQVGDISISITVTITNGETITIGTQIQEIDGVTVESNVVVSEDNIVHNCSFENEVKDFIISVPEGEGIVNMKNAGENAAYVATEVGSFMVNVKYIGKNSNLPATGTNIVKWEVVEGSGATGNGRTITFGANPTDDIVLEATSENGTTERFTIKVARTTAASATLANKTVANNMKLAFVHTPNATNNTHTAVKGTSTYNKYASAVTLDETITISVDGEGLTANGASVTTTGGDHSGKLTVKVGEYVTYVFDYVTYDTSLFTVVPKKNDIYVGTNQDIALSDLFAGTIPAGAELKVFSNVDSGDDYMNIKRGEMTLATDVGSNGVLCGIDKNVIENAAMSSTIKFTGTRTQQVYFAFFKDGVRISDDLRVTVVDAKNVRSFADLTGATNYALLNNIEIGTDGTWALTGGTLYGNFYTFDIQKGKTTGTFGIITLSNARMQDTRVVGALYPTVGISAMDPYGSNAIHAKGTTTIDNCYIANCRAPLAVGHEDSAVTVDNVTVSNSVLFGGKFCSVEVRNGTLNFAGKEVITINQPHTNVENVADVAMNNRTTGLGVTVWFEAKSGTKINGADKLTQYNFIPQTYTNLPVITISMSSISINLATSEMANKLFTDNKYSGYQFTKDGVKYINASILGEDLGSAASALGKIIGKDLPSGDRTGFNKGASSPADKYSYVDYTQKVKISIISYPVHLHIYGLKNTNTDVFNASQNAEFKYSPWKNVVGTTTYEAYDFVNGNIIH